MNVAMLSDTETSGGAAIAASRLAIGLNDAGHRVTRIVARSDRTPRPAWSSISPRTCLVGRVACRLHLDKWWLPAARVLCGDEIDSMLTDIKPDVINVHNLHGADALGFSQELLRICSVHAPTVWTLHDMWSFTGRCAYSYDCRKFVAGCDARCPTPTEYPALSPGKISGAWRSRLGLLESSPQLVAVTPSQWLAREAASGLWEGHRVETIPNGLSLDSYVVLDRVMARQALGIGDEGPVLLSSAENLADRRKGGSLLVEALARLNTGPIVLVTLGHGGLVVNADGVDVVNLGFIDHERTKVLAYNAADIFVHPALADNLPNVVMEAIACGTPVVGFPVGGVPEMVRPGQTGWLAGEVSPEALVAAIDGAVQDIKTGNDMRSSCRDVAESEYDVRMQVHHYLKLFKSLGVAE